MWQLTQADKVAALSETVGVDLGYGRGEQEYPGPDRHTDSISFLTASWIQLGHIDDVSDRGRGEPSRS